MEGSLLEKHATGRLERVEQHFFLSFLHLFSHACKTLNPWQIAYFQRSQGSHAKKCWTLKQIRQKGYDMAVYVAVAYLWSSCMVITPTVHLSSEVSQDIPLFTYIMNRGSLPLGRGVGGIILHRNTKKNGHTRQILSINSVLFLTLLLASLCVFLLLTISSFSPSHIFSIQVRCLGTTTPPSSPAVRWWTSAVMSSSSTSARRLSAARRRGRTMPLGALSRRRPMRRPRSSRAAWGHKGTLSPTAPCKTKHCQSRKRWRSGHLENEKGSVALYLSVQWSSPQSSVITKMNSYHFWW